MDGVSILEAKFASSLKGLPGVRAGLSNPAALLAVCRSKGRSKEAVLHAAAISVSEGKEYPEGHASRENLFDMADALYFYHDHIEQMERYEAEVRAAKEPPRFLTV